MSGEDGSGLVTERQESQRIIIPLPGGTSELRQILPIPEEVDAFYPLLVRNQTYWNRYEREGSVIREDPEAERQLMLAGLNDPDYRFFGLWENGIAIGFVTLLVMEEDPAQAEFGGALDEAYSSQGRATSAANALMDYAFDNLGVNRFWARTNPANQASVKVLSKLGFGIDELVFSKSKP